MTEPTIWRDPPEETTDYPGLFVWDARVSGSITTGQSRLPLWAFMGVAIVHGWAEAESGWEPSEYGWTADRAGEFVYDLLEMRGEFGRLLCVLADVERRDRIRDEAAAEGHGPVFQVKVFDTDPEDAVEMPDPWWGQDEDRERVLAALRRCIGVLTGSSAPDMGTASSPTTEEVTVEERENKETTTEKETVETPTGKHTVEQTEQTERVDKKSDKNDEDGSSSDE